MLTFSRLAPLVLLFVGILFFVDPAVQADVFDDHSAKVLRQAVANVQPVATLSMKDAARLKPLGRRLSSPCIVIHTNEDNWAKALVVWGLRKSKDGSVPVLLIERYVTYRGDRPNLTAAVGKDVMLFPGFTFNFDLGQVVPEGNGEDIKFNAETGIAAIGNAKLYGLSGSALPESSGDAVPNPSAHEEVLPTDFAGAWHVRIDGRWEGRLDLIVDGRRISGKLVSEDTKNEYEAHGRIVAEAHHLRFDVELANASQSFDAYLWTKDKSAMAGTVAIADRTVGFYATRVKPDE